MYITRATRAHFVPPRSRRSCAVTEHGLFCPRRRVGLFRLQPGGRPMCKSIKGLFIVRVEWDGTRKKGLPPMWRGPSKESAMICLERCKGSSKFGTSSRISGLTPATKIWGQGKFLCHGSPILGGGIRLVGVLYYQCKGQDTC
jgi:hypothetical protein